ncbi:MAG: hypothetical protein JW846_01780 [Dehalococcoidia bacterium]|nr:hypothetical protein [Dehalococcoidia bacterium]
MARNYHEGKSGWHVAPMNRLEWVETGLKVTAMVIAFIVVVRVIVSGDFSWSGVDGGLQARIFRWMAIALAIAIVDRLQQRELVSIAFVIFNDLAHWSMHFALLSGFSMAAPIVAYCALMAAGDVVKIVFFATTGYTVRGAPRALLVAGVAAFVVGYVVILVLSL